MTEGRSYVILAAYADGVWAVWDGSWAHRRLSKAHRYSTHEEAQAALEAARNSLEWDSEDGLPDVLIASIVDGAP